MKRVKVGIIILIILLILSSGLYILNTKNNNSEHGSEGIRHFAWYYPNFPEDQLPVVEEFQNLGFTDLLISIDARLLDSSLSSYDEDYKENLTNLISILTAHKIKSSLMTLESPYFYNSTTSAEVHLDAINSYLRSTKVSITGIHFDIEPHTLNRWDNESLQGEIFTTYLNTLQDLGEYMTGLTFIADLEHSIAVPWWYQEKGYDDRYPHALDSYEMLFFMVYGGIGDEIDDYRRVEDELQQSKGVLGYGFDEFNSKAETISFRDQLTTRYANHTNVVGTSLFSFNKLIA